MIMIIDTKEQLPLDFSKYKEVDSVVRQNLTEGDYSAVSNNGQTCPYIFERKSLADLFSTLTRGNKRFHREIDRAKKNNTKLVLVVEGTLSDVFKGIKYSEISGLTILKTMITLFQKYKLYHIFFSNRSEMTEYIVRFYQSYFKHYRSLQDEC